MREQGRTERRPACLITTNTDRGFYERESSDHPMYDSFCHCSYTLGAILFHDAIRAHWTGKFECQLYSQHAVSWLICSLILISHIFPCDKTIFLKHTLCWIFPCHWSTFPLFLLAVMEFYSTFCTHVCIFDSLCYNLLLFLFLKSHQH